MISILKNKIKVDKNIQTDNIDIDINQNSYLI
jgi:hypothetical protein